MQFKIRCSAINQIMGGNVGLTDKQLGEFNTLLNKEKRTAIQEKKLQDYKFKIDNPQLPTGAKTYCKKWLLDQVYNRRKLDIQSKYTEKGNLCEEEAIELIGEHFKLGMIFKNEQYKENDFLTGTCDVNLKEIIIDNKCSYDHSTFPLFESEINQDYFAQLQGYMELYNKNESWIVYTLVNLPLELIEREIYSHSDMEEEEIDNYFNYDSLPKSKRIKRYIIKRDKKYIEQVKERVYLCQRYIDNLLMDLEINK